ncbi:hypothetical protein MRX96_041316 [Rhipicephalus microplus]
MSAVSRGHTAARKRQPNAFHSLFLLGLFLAVFTSTEIVTHLKFASIDTSISEICFVLVPRMLMLFATIVVDLLLVIGIEDNIIFDYGREVMVLGAGTITVVVAT